MHAHPAPQPQMAPPDERTPVRVYLLDRFHRCSPAPLAAWKALCHWMQATSNTPEWLSARWRGPHAGYLLALLAGVAAATVTFLAGALAPGLHLDVCILLGAVVLVALTCGVGPSLLATGVAGLLLAAVLLQASLAGPAHTEDWVDLVLLLVSGLGLSLLAGQAGRARRRAEALAVSLCVAKAESDVERRRLRTLLDVLPVPVTMVDTQGQFLETTPANQSIWGNPASWAHKLAEVPTYPARRPDTGQPVARDDLPIVRALTSGECILDEELEFETADGQRKILLNSATPVRDETAAIHGAVSIVQDITERKRMEEALRQAERAAATHARELEAIFEALTDGLLVYDSEGRILRCNGAARQLLGFEAYPEFAALPWKERATRYTARDAEGQPVAPENLAVSRLLRGEVLCGSHAAEDRLHTPDGREVAFSMTGRPLRDTEGNIVGAVAVARDETERRRLEQQTRDSLDALLAMAEALVQGQGQGHVHLHEHQDMEEAQGLAQALRSGADPELAAVAGRLAELTRRVLDCRSVSITAVDAQTDVLMPITVVGHSRADEQRWWAGRKWFGEGEGRLQLRNVTPLDVVEALRSGETVLPEDVPAPFLRWLQQHSQVRPSVLVPMRVGEVLVGVLQIEGEERRAPGKASATEQKGALVQAVARLGALVLERERLQRERTQAQAAALALRAMQTQMEAFLATAAHDLRTPLTAVVGYLDLAQRQTERLVTTVREASPELAPRVEAVRARLDDAGEGAERLTRLLNMLFDTAAMRAGKLELRRTPCDLSALVREQVEALRVAAPDRVIQLHMPAASGEQIIVEADADRIGQVLMNYMTNALKYSPPDTPLDVSVEAQRSGTHVARVAVRDQGPGLPKEEHARVWKPFHRAAGVEVRGGAPGGAAGGSLGLGLHICKAIVEAHTGQVGVESAAGQGSTFWFTLPLASEPAIAGATSASPDAAGEPAR